ncbi:MAG: cation diffusion facilitator family transporter [Steroidobacteraceae bacterium]|jgi:cation diffusion facilitator family transporter|nr:cation diffusion facilitator family transporter [Steroidobacteraceae bacterium]
MKESVSLTRFAWLSVAAAVATILLKGAAWWLTGSVGLLSDALESFVNLAGALMALWMLTLAARPADEDHAYGHGKAEYFSSGVEGALILIAAASIAWAAIGRLLEPQPLERIGLGVGVSALAAMLNLGTSLVLMRAARQHESITLRANAHHLLTDVWTSAGVVAAVAAVALTGWLWLDPVVALAVAANIVWTGTRIVRSSIDGLMDRALPEQELAVLRAVLDRYTGPHVRYHALRTRQSGRRRFVSVHVLVPGTWSVGEGHRLLEYLEADLRAALPNTSVFTHLEPLGDPAAMNDLDLDR